MALAPVSPSAPEPAAPDGDAKDPTAEVVADAFVDDVVVEKQNDALDALVARDRELVASEVTQATEQALPAKKATKAQEWTAAIVLMVIFAAVCLALMTFFASAGQ